MDRFGTMETIGGTTTIEGRNVVTRIVCTSWLFIVLVEYGCVEATAELERIWFGGDGETFSDV